VKNSLSFKFCKELIVSLCFLYMAFTGAFAQVQPLIVDIYNNGNKLDAKFWHAGNATFPPTVILLHGFPGNEASPYSLAEKLNSKGLNVLIFNYEGSFKSEGVFSWENCLADVGAAVSFLKQKKTMEQFAIDTSKITVCGTSLGASFALSAALHNPEIKSLIAVVGGNDLSVYLQNMKNDPAYRNASSNIQASEEIVSRRSFNQSHRNRSFFYQRPG